jgi:GNAT superfamily N-acetyltransferase
MTDTILTERLSLRPMTPELAQSLGPALAGIDPWLRMNFPPEQMTAFFTRPDAALTLRVVMADGEPGGVIAVRSPWLRGPYLQQLALLPPFQGQGFGAHLLAWFERQAGPQQRWLWLCHSSFNTRAGRFYTHHGFEQVALLPELIVDGSDEVLMRKRINAGG